MGYNVNTNIAGYSKNSVSPSWLLERNIFAAGNNEVSMGDVSLIIIVKCQGL